MVLFQSNIGIQSQSSVACGAHSGRGMYGGGMLRWECIGDGKMW